MKTNDNEQVRKFKNQLNHLQSFIGMPLENRHKPSLSEIRENDRRLLEKQALGYKPRRESLLKHLFISLSNTKQRIFSRYTKVRVN